MAQPATIVPDFPAELYGIALPDDRGGPANQALAELSLALSANEPDASKWSEGKSLRFIIASCSMFWITAAAALYSLS